MEVLCRFVGNDVLQSVKVFHRFGF
jgi:hypothetical protein